MCRAGGPRCSGGGRHVPVQSGTVNVASGDDVVGMQVGTYVSGDSAGDSPEVAAVYDDVMARVASVVNVVADGARVGMQTDVFVGDLNIRM